jgi:pyruvate dehydrogenase phosphatase
VQSYDAIKNNCILKRLAYNFFQFLMKVLRNLGTSTVNQQSNRLLYYSVGGIGAGMVGYWYYNKGNTPAKLASPNRLPAIDNRISMEKVKQIIAENEQSLTTKNRAIFRMDLNSVGSNKRCEDAHSEGSLSDKGAIVGIFDGHGGYECGVIVAKYLASYVAHEMKQDHSQESKKQHIISAIQKGFLQLDHDITNCCLKDFRPKVQWSWFSKPDYDSIYKSLRVAVSGACALVAVIDDQDLYVACTGDCRAVLGRKITDQDGGVYEAIQLTQDQTPRNPVEFSRLCEEHPGEDATVVVRGRVLGGLMPSRAFGIP